MTNTANTNEQKEMTLLEFFEYTERAMDLAFERRDTDKTIFTNIMYHARRFDKEQLTYELMQKKAKERGEPELWEMPQSFEKPVQMMKFNPDSCLPDLLRDYLK
ncbi:MAG: hypothetical protein K2O60_10500, partial [Ruminococcus sp.]|nr:hypothetical protein [Ruminococcus sp.]